MMYGKKVHEQTLAANLNTRSLRIYNTEQLFANYPRAFTADERVTSAMQFMVRSQISP